MLKNNNDDFLKEKYDEEFIYFIQLWNELLDSRTIDIYQHNIMNTFLSMKELLEVTDNTLNGIYISSHNLDDCKSETSVLLKDDDILKKINPFLYNSLTNRINSKTDSKESRLALCAQLRSSIRYLDKLYANTIFDALWNDISIKDEKSITKHTKMIISQCINDGWSQKALMETIRFLNKNAISSLKEKWEKFVNVLLHTNDIIHHVYIEISFQTPSSEKKELAINKLESMGCKILDYKKISEQYNENLSSYINSDKTYLFLEQSSPDIYSAALQALQSISDKINLISFYGLINYWTISSTAIFVINPVTKYKKSFPAESLFKPYEYIDITNKVFDKTKDIFSSSEGNNIVEKLSGAFAYTNISKSSMFQEAKFINLWVALESLIRSDLYKDIITNLKEVVPAACAKRYLFSIMRNFIEDCERCNVALDFTTCDTITTDEKHEAVKKLLCVFLENSTYDELQSKTKKNTLLYKRCEEIHDFLTNYSKLKSRLENHYQMIRWQIQRLYRIRNGIAHSASQRCLSNVHLKHLFSYLSITILEIIAIETKSNFANLDEIYCKIIDDYKSAIELLTNTRCNSVIRDTILKTGFIDLI